jgi:phage terminase small subunit
MTPKEKRFTQEYPVDFCGAKAAVRSGYSEKRAKVTAHELLKKSAIREAINERMKEHSMDSEETMLRLSDMARASLLPFLKFDDKKSFTIDIASKEGKSKLHTIKKLKHRRRTTADGTIIDEIEIELHDPLKALDKILKVHGEYETNQATSNHNILTSHIDKLNAAMNRLSD